MRECKRANCFVPDTGCDLGHTDLAECPAWGGAEVKAEELITGDEVLLPWSGSALGPADVPFVSGRARPFVVGVAGSQNAGKTTLLGAWYLLLGRGAVAVEEHQFAGSYSFAGWEAVAGSLRWEPGHPPTFPPHTPSRSGRAPGLLHLAFWDGDRGRTLDYLFADAPGEWFQKWAINRDSPEGAGARWVADRADVFLVIADREALSGENMGSARSGLRLLARRLADARRGRPVALIWTKADVPVADEMERAVRDAVLGALPDAAEFSVSVVSGEGDESGTGQGLIQLLNWILAVRRARVELPRSLGARNDPLFMYSGRSL